MSDQAKGLMITGLAVLFILPDSLFVRLIDASGMTIVFWRSATIAFTTALYVIFAYGREGLSCWVRPSKYQKIYGVLSIFSAAFFVLSVQNTSVANTVFIIASIPVFSALFSWLFLGERISRRLVITIILVIIGVGIIAAGSGETEGAHITGDLLALCASISFAGALTTSRAARPESMVPIVPVAFAIAALLCLFVTNPFEVRSDQYHLLFMHGGVFMAGAMILFAIGPRFISSAEAGLLILGESIGAPLLAWAFIGEFPGRWTLIGGALILVTLFVSNLVALRRSKRA